MYLLQTGRKDFDTWTLAHDLGSITDNDLFDIVTSTTPTTGVRALVGAVRLAMWFEGLQDPSDSMGSSLSCCCRCALA